MIVLDICLSDIPKEQIVRASNGKAYCKLVVAERREEDRYGNNLTVYMSARKEDRDKPKQYVGSGKSYNTVRKAEPATITNANTLNNNGADDMPW